jgi:hypothetical protein
MQLTRLIYHSKFAMKSRGAALGADLKLLLASSVRNNLDRDVTGGLIFNRSLFIQVLEGDRTAIEETMARIVKDPRHNDIVVVESNLQSERLFGAWSMGFAGNSDRFSMICERFGYPDGLDPASMTTNDLLAIVMEVVHSEEHMTSTANA